MPRVPKKALKLSTEIDIHAISCPGVILLNRGRLALSLCLLGFHTRTGRLPAKFPIEYREKFKFDRTFVSVTNLSVLERVLESETVYLELIQEEASGETVLAVFESSVRDLLFPKQAERLSYSGNDLDLLMEPTRDFPGIISPKIEVSTRTVIGEMRSPLHQCSQDNVSFGHTNNRSTKATYKPMERALDAERDTEKGDSKSKSVAFGPRDNYLDGRSLEEKESLRMGLSEAAQILLRKSQSLGTEKDGSLGRSEDPIRNRVLRPPFAYKRPENRLLSQLPPSPTRNNRYLGIRSRYLSRSAGNITDLSGQEENERSNFKSNNSPKLPRRKCYDDGVENARVSMVEPERCPHCEGEHGAESCTTCRTYHRFFPRPNHQSPHFHAHVLHAHPHFNEAGLKILEQPAYLNRRRRKRYLVDIDSAKESLYGEKRPPLRRPASAPPTRMAEGSGISADEQEDTDEEERANKDSERRVRAKKKDSKRLSFSRSISRSPSPPASHASAPPALSRTRHLDSDFDDDPLDEFYYRRRYNYPYFNRSFYPYDYECPLCDPDCSSGLSKYYRKYTRGFPCYDDFPKSSYRRDLYHSKGDCSVCYKYGLYLPYLYQKSRYYPSKYPFHRQYPYWDSLPTRYDSDNDSPRDSKFTSKGTRVKFRKKRVTDALESADEILSDIYNND